MAKSIMIQGTMSNAGKSLLVAGLCRVFYQDGYRVAPFKSQNMALNSYITQDGYEMGRAQVMQAEAAGIEPDIDMNPILLKPTSNIGSQVIINGRVEGNMKAMQYYKEKTKYIPDIMNAYERLSAKMTLLYLREQEVRQRLILRIMILSIWEWQKWHIHLYCLQGISTGVVYLRNYMELLHFLRILKEII